jgi:hypothetical protein
VTELERGVDARCRHCRFQPGLEGHCIGMGENTKAIVLLAIPFVVEDEGEPRVQ